MRLPDHHFLLAIELIVAIVCAVSLFRFSCFNPEDGNDPSIGLLSGELVIPGLVIKREVFDPIIGPSLALSPQIPLTPRGLQTKSSRSSNSSSPKSPSKSTRSSSSAASPRPSTSSRACARSLAAASPSLRGRRIAMSQPFVRFLFHSV